MRKVSNSDNIRKRPQNRKQVFLLFIGCFWEHRRRDSLCPLGLRLKDTIGNRPSKTEGGRRALRMICYWRSVSFLFFPDPPRRSSPPRGRILLGDQIQKIWWSIILKTNLQGKDFAEKNLREICYSHIRNSLKNFIGQRRISRSGENDEKTLYGQRKNEIWPKQGKEGIHRQLWRVTEYYMFMCQQFRIIELSWPTFAPLYQNKNCKGGLPWLCNG